MNYTSSAAHHNVDVQGSIEAHNQLMIDTMDSILEKSLATIFEANSKQKSYLESELGDLRIEKAGGLVFKSGAGPKMVVTVVGAKPELEEE